MPMPADVLVFDMDGVLLQSNTLKHEAMLDLFEMGEAQRQAVARYNLGAGGVPRRQKFAHIWAEILGRPYGPAIEEALADAYEHALGRRLLEVPLVEGVQAFIESCGLPCHVCTAAPEHEAREVLSQRGLAGLFERIFGAPATKQEALATIAHIARCTPDRLLFFGESSADLEAARAIGCRFVGVTREKNDFAHDEVPTIRDFADEARLQQASRAASAQR
jgi:phosphoglycolate phosphatase-like HAD superfamily hydrolase